jgi:hypothetical protein
MDGAYSTYEEKRIEDRVVVGKTDGDHLEDLGVDVRIL